VTFAIAKRLCVMCLSAPKPTLEGTLDLPVLKILFRECKLHVSPVAPDGEGRWTRAEWVRKETGSRRESIN
jgi:hypothetical protein